MIHWYCYTIQIKISRWKYTILLGFVKKVNWKLIALQGDTWGPIMAYNEADTYGKELLEEEPSYIYKYKGYVPIQGLCENWCLWYDRRWSRGPWERNKSQTSKFINEERKLILSHWYYKLNLFLLNLNNLTDSR